MTYHRFKPFEHQSAKSSKPFKRWSKKALSEPSEPPLNPNEPKTLKPSKKPPTGPRLRALAFAMLGRQELSKQQLTQKLLLTEAEAEEVKALVEELAASDYQSDARMAAMTVRANARKGRGPARVRQDLKTRAIDVELAQDSLNNTNWLELAVQLRRRKFGIELPNDAKEKARQLRFLMYRGFTMDMCLKALKVANDTDLEALLFD